MSKPTPGPWKWYWKYTNGETDCGIVSDEGYSICRAPRYQTKEQWEADAALISAAPDLLATLKEVMTMLEPIEQYMSVAWADMMKHCRNAIRKAEGSE